MQGFPTIVRVRGDRYAEYGGARDTVALLQWAQSEPAEWRTVGAPPADGAADDGADDGAGPLPDLSAVTVAAADVAALDDTTFAVALAAAAQRPLMIDFYATWCGHCKVGCCDVCCDML